MYAHLTSPATGNTLTIDVVDTRSGGATVTFDGVSDNAPTHVTKTFSTRQAADLWAQGLRESLIAGGLQDTTPAS